MVRREEPELGAVARLPIADPEEFGFANSRLDRVSRWLDDQNISGRLSGASVAIIRGGHIVYAGSAGYSDIARGTPMTHRTLVRIKSMTKPLTSCAVLTLFEQGHFQLDDPISDFLAYFDDHRVLVGGTIDRLLTVPANRAITFRDLLTHTAGLTYGFINKTPVDEMYRRHEVDFQLDSPLRRGPPGHTLGEMVELAASMPLLAQPGQRWNYSIATDVLGHLLSVISGVELPAFLDTRLFGPLGMNDSAFTVPREKLSLFAAHYAPIDDGLVLLDDPQKSRFASVPTLHSGGGGVVSTLGDYLRFCQMLLNGGTLDGNRVLGRKTVELMRSNHLAGDIEECGTLMRGTTYPGVGFGLGVSVMLDPARAQILGTRGEFGWTGSASTAFWIDPAEDLGVVFFTQLTPDWTYPLRRELRVLTYQALAG